MIAAMGFTDFDPPPEPLPTQAPWPAAADAPRQPRRDELRRGDR
jgi:hypothetical protein